MANTDPGDGVTSEKILDHSFALSIISRLALVLTICSFLTGL